MPEKLLTLVPCWNPFQADIAPGVTFDHYSALDAVGCEPDTCIRLELNSGRFLSWGSIVITDSRRIVATALAGVLVWSFNVSASPQTELTEAGQANLDAGRPVAALAKFEAAHRADPNDAETVFLEGAALNRMGRHARAIERLQIARQMGLRHREMAFETGFALLGGGQFKAATVLLGAYEKANPGRAETSELRGRAYFFLGEADQAEAMLRQAVDRDPQLAESVGPYLARIDRVGDDKAASTTLAAGSVSPATQTLDDAAAGPDKRWRVSVRAGAGWSDNIIATANAISIPRDITNRDGGFGTLGVHGAFDLIRTDADLLTIGYAVGADMYIDGSSEANLIDHIVYADWRHACTDKLTGSLRVSDEFTQLGGSTFRNAVLIRPGVAYEVADWLTAEVAYTFAASEYSFPIIAPVIDRDGEAHRFEIGAWIDVPDTDLQARLGYFHVVNEADGSDFDYDSDGLYVGLAHPLPFDFEGELMWTRIWADYDNPNLFTGTGVAREDDVDVISIALSRPIDLSLPGDARLFIRYEFVRDDSNVFLYDYDQETISAGIIVDF